MIDADDVTRAYPEAGAFDHAKLKHWIDIANVAIFPARLKDPKTERVAQIAFVMHQLTKPALNLAAPHVVARARSPGRAAASVKAPHVWSGTPHGVRLASAVKY